MDSKLVVYLLSAFALCVIGLTQYIFRRIKHADANLFDALGRPDVITNNTPANAAAFWRWVFLSAKNYRGDAILTRLVAVLKLVTCAFFACIVLLLFSNW